MTGRLLLIATALLLAVATGCSGSSDEPQVAAIEDVADEASETNGTETTAPEDPQEAILAFTDCLRDHGFDVPDPQFGGPGGRREAFEDAGIDPEDPEFRAAQEECRPLLAAIQQRFDGEDRQASEDAALEFARCMRERGFDVPDPQFDSGPPVAGIFGGDAERDDPEFQEAREVCSQAFEELEGRFGGRDE